MTEVRYTPGSLRVVVAGRGVAVLGEGTTDAATLAIRDRLAGGEGFGAVVDVLAAGASFADLPAFVVAIDEGAVWRVSARGALSAVVTIGSDTEVVDGSSASTWSERSIPDVTRLTVGDADTAALPIADGVVLAAAIVVSADASVTRAETLSAPETAAPPPAAAPPVAPAEPVQPHSLDEVRDLAAPAPPAAADPAPELEIVPEPGTAPGPEAAPEPEPVSPPPFLVADEGVLIDSIPPFIRGDALPMKTGVAPAAAPPRAPAPSPASSPIPAAAAAAGPSTDELEATTVIGRPPRDAAPESAPTRTTGLPAPAPGDHDGETLSLEEARRLRAGGSLPTPPPPVPVPPVPALVLGRLRLSTGQVVPLDRTVIVGRRPRSSRASGADMPHLIGVDSPQQDISRNHVEVRVEGDSILATDLQTTNGTTLRRQGSVPTRLHPGEATMLVVGDVLDLGDGMTITVESLA